MTTVTLAVLIVGGSDVDGFDDSDCGSCNVDACCALDDSLKHLFVDGLLIA